jgi:DNA mismatch repair ATPase MutS
MVLGRSVNKWAPGTLAELIAARDYSFIGLLIDSLKKGDDDTLLNNNNQTSTNPTNKWLPFLSLLVWPLYELDLALGAMKAVRVNQLRPPTLLNEANFFEMSEARPYMPNLSGGSQYISGGQEISFKIEDSNSVSIVFGPNNTGKTTFALNCVGNLNLALNGFFVPAELKVSTNLKLRQFLGTNSRGSRGLFRNTLENLGAILQDASTGTVIFLDEIKGTDFVELAAIQLAVIQYCRENNIFLIYNTHVKDGMEGLKECGNVSFFATSYQVEPETLRLTTTYKIVPDPDLSAASYGLEVARRYFPELFSG